MKNPTLSWLIGQIETDGSFMLNISRPTGLFKPYIKISSKTNTNVLTLLQKILQKYGVSSKLHKAAKSTKGNRAPEIRINGQNQILKFLQIVSQSGFYFIGKYRDALLMRVAVEKELNIAQKIGVKKSLHKNNRFESDLVTSTQIISRAQYEVNFELKPNESVVESDRLLRCIDIVCRMRRYDLLQQMSQKTLMVPNDYIKGIVDGDGNLNIGTTVVNGKAVWDVKVSFALDIHSYTVAMILQYCWNSNATIAKISSQKDPNQKTSLSVKFRNNQDVQSVVAYFRKNGGSYGDIRRRQLALVYLYLRLQKNGGLKTKTKAFALAEKVYKLSDQYIKGQKRTDFNLFISAL